MPYHLATPAKVLAALLDCSGSPALILPCPWMTVKRGLAILCRLSSASPVLTIPDPTAFTAYNILGMETIVRPARLALPALITLTFVLIFGSAAAQPAQPEVLLLVYDGPVTPVMVEYMKRGVRLAEERRAEAIIFQLNTPGGSVDITLDMVEVMRASRVPVVVYIAPRGAIAGSAGTVITAAGHVSAMAPDTAIGAASPVGAQGEDIGETLETKIKEALKATLRSLLERRPPEAIALAEDTVENAAAASAQEALEVGLIDLIAEDPDDLLAQLQGRTVETAGGTRTLNTHDLTVTEIPLTLIERLLQVLTNPNIVFILLTIGVQAILIELGSPGGWVAGFLGVIFLALAGYGLGVLNVNWFGLIFLVTAFVLFVLELKAVTHGALTAAGAASFIIGALVLFNTPNTPDFQRVSIPLVVASAALMAGTFALVMTFAVRSLRAPVRTGVETVVGRTGRARSDLNPRGMVHVGGELWTAELLDGEEPIPAGSRVEVVATRGLRLLVRRAP